MKISLTQAYIEPGISYSLSWKFQHLVSDTISQLVQSSEFFQSEYGSDYDLCFYLSSKSEITENEIHGPCVAKRDKEVEYTIFIPHFPCSTNNRPQFRKPLASFFDGMVEILESLQIDCTLVKEKCCDLIEEIIANEEMFEERE